MMEDFKTIYYGLQQARNSCTNLMYGIPPLSTTITVGLNLIMDIIGRNNNKSWQMSRSRG
jgi:hypothetical protein